MSYGNSNTDYYSDDKNLSDYEKAPFEGCGDFFNTPVKNSQSHSSSQPLPGDLYSSYRRTPHKSPPDHFSHSSRPPPEMAEDPYRDFYEANALTSATPTSSETQPMNKPPSRHWNVKELERESLERYHKAMKYSGSSGYAYASNSYTRYQTPSISDDDEPPSSNQGSHRGYCLPPSQRLPTNMSVSPRPPVSSAYSTSSASTVSTRENTPQPDPYPLTPGWSTNRERTPEPNRYVETAEQKVDLLSRSTTGGKRVPDYTPFYRKTPKKVAFEVRTPTRSVSGNSVPGDSASDDLPIAQRRATREAARRNPYCQENMLNQSPKQRK